MIVNTFNYKVDVLTTTYLGMPATQGYIDHLVWTTLLEKGFTKIRYLEGVSFLAVQENSICKCSSSTVCRQIAAMFSGHARSHHGNSPLMRVIHYRPMRKLYASIQLP